MGKRFRATIELTTVNEQKLQDILTLLEQIKYNGNFAYPVSELEVISTEMLEDKDGRNR